MPTSSPVPSQPANPADDLLDPTIAELRNQLGLRPTAYREWGDHPDDRPCPSWCWVAHSNGEQKHQINPRRPLSALHHIENVIATVASLYTGESALGGGDRVVRTATVEADLTQVGTNDPVITLYLRRWESREPRYNKQLVLTLADAWELVAAMSQLLDQAGHSRDA